MSPAATKAEIEAARDRAALQAALLVEDGMVVGLGTGDTARRFIEQLAQRARSESLKLTCVATSGGSAGIARGGGLLVRTLGECPRLDLAVDGADEVTPALDLMKGGGARTRGRRSWPLPPRASSSSWTKRSWCGAWATISRCPPR